MKKPKKFKKSFLYLLIIIFFVVIIFIFFSKIIVYNPNLQSELSIDNTSEYKKYLESWKTYQSPDKTITFKYPENWKINELNWRDGVLGIMYEDSTIIQILKIEKNSVSIEDRISDDTKNQTANITNTTINGSSATKVQIAPKNNITKGETIYYFPKNNYYIEINISKIGDTLYDIPADYLINTFKIY